MSNEKRKVRKHLYSHYPEFTKYPMTAEWSALWFEDHEVFYVSSEDQREVTLNPGFEEEWFNQTYADVGNVVLSKKKYLPDLPQNTKGHIIAYAAVPRYRSKIHSGAYKGQNFNDVKNLLSAEEMSREGLVVPQVMGTYYELFKSVSGQLIWVNPKEYYEDAEQNKRIKNKIFGGASKNSNKAKKNKRHSRQQ